MIEKSKSTSPDLARLDAHVIQPEEYEDAPELTEEEAARAIVHINGVPVKRGRPALVNPKIHLNLRLDADIVARAKRSGDGWQTKLNALLRKAYRLDEAKKRKRA